MSRRLWTEDEIEYMRTHYSDALMEDLMTALSRSKSSIYQGARNLGLYKSAEHVKKYAGFKPGHKNGIQYQFKPGATPHNKGKKGWEAGGNSKRTRFRTGNRSQTWVPVGSIRKTKGGVLQRKISDTGYTPRDWKPIHSLLWKEHHGEIPKGHIVVFKNKDITDIRIDNLECISRAENMRRNSVHNLPEPLVELVRLRGILNRHINKKGGKNGNEKQD